MTQAVVPSHLVMTERLLGARLLGWIFPWSITTPWGVAEGKELGWGKYPWKCAAGTALLLCHVRQG